MNIYSMCKFVKCTYFRSFSSIKRINITRDLCLQKTHVGIWRILFDYQNSKDIDLPFLIICFYLFPSLSKIANSLKENNYGENWEPEFFVVEFEFSNFLRIEAVTILATVSSNLISIMM